MFEQKRNVLVYYRDDGTLGGMLDMDGAEILHVHDIGKGSGTSKQTFGFNKPTAFELLVSTTLCVFCLCNDVLGGFFLL